MIFLNALRGVQAKILTPKTGAWLADVDVDLADIPVAPTGRATLVIGTTALVGTIDDRASGRFGSKGKARLVAGGGGWDKPVAALHLHNDAGVFSTAVYSATAASVGESVVELGPPKRLGVDYARMRGAASSVFAGVDWYVNLLGITQVGRRLPLPAPPTIDILSWDPTTQVAEIASDDLILPGMTLVDPLRFGTAVVDDVEQTFGDEGGRAIAWCSTPSLGAALSPFASPPPAAGNRVVRALASLAKQSAETRALRRYAYRVVTQGIDGRINLAAVNITGDAPPFLRLIDIWAGLPGLSVKLAPASVVTVEFLEGDLAKPRIVSFDPKSPPAIEIKLDALRVVAGATGTHPVARADQVVACIAAVAAAGGITAPAMIAAAALYATTIPSTKLFTD